MICSFLVADMVLLDDNFASIIIGVEEGRRIFDNFKKTVAYVLRKNFAELVPFLAYIVFGLPLPLGTITMLCIDLGTDIIPSITIGYEKAESDIMKRPPRQKTERLVNFQVFALAYFQIGFIQGMAGFFAYFWVMADNGWMPMRLFFLRKEWDSVGVNNLEDSYGQEWTYDQRKVLEATCQTAFFIAIVVTQWADLLVVKTRRNSLVQQGMDNWPLNFALLIETAIAVFLAYTPGVSHGLNMHGLKFAWWFPALPFALYLFNYDEMRRFWIRHWPNGWAKRELLGREKEEKERKKEEIVGRRDEQRNGKSTGGRRDEQRNGKSIGGRRDVQRNGKSIGGRRDEQRNGKSIGEGETNREMGKGKSIVEMRRA
ncbi:hypothetical protein niasHT_015617 [Heterodera trifolii]|uniref:Cation-transporting P-type ATPase C-terminal domain-containing protein n=1 Tax=Heterodera trifolii TaxID=157864 RepID=A0ABD2LCI4_9BILA